MIYRFYRIKQKVKFKQHSRGRAAIGVLGAVLALLFAVAGCSDDAETRKDNGAPCLSHDECRSGLCTLDVTVDAGPAGDGGTNRKRCTAPSL